VELKNDMRKICATLSWGLILFTWLVIYERLAMGSEVGLAERVVEHNLSNGMKVLMVERHQVPLVSLNMIYRVGSVNERTGMTGVAHLFEHMAFKGTSTLGSRNYEEERPVLEEMESIDEAIHQEEAKGASADPAVIQKLQKRFEELDREAQAYVIPNEIGELYDKNGGVGFNAGTSRDFTRYTVSLPSNRLPLWTAIESDRMAKTVLREFYKEKQVVLEERRLRVDNEPSGKLSEVFLATAFQAHPYGLPTIGWESDVASLTMAQTRDFFETYYTPQNAVLAVVGDIHPKELIKLLEDSFRKVSGRPVSAFNITQEPEQTGERRVEVEFEANPQVMIGYHKPPIRTEDADVFGVIDSLLSEGRTSRLYNRLVKEKQLALSVSTGADMPGARYPNLFVITAAPRLPHTTQELEEAIYAELERLKKESVEQRELTKILNRLDASLVRSLSTNSGLAAQLAYYETVAGSWRYLLDERERVAKVTSEDVMRVAKKYFIKSNRTVATLVKKVKE
jgi:predicted Zn-dependent peptidase